MIGTIREYLRKCSYFNDFKALGVDFLSDDGTVASIEKKPINPIKTTYVTGTKLKQVSFNILARLNHTTELQQQIENSDLFENIEDWIEEQNDLENFPDFGTYKKVTGISVGSCGYLVGYDPTLRTAVYQIQIIVEYEKINKNNPFKDFFI